ncbi:MAG: polysaccharide deacetylase family protein [Alphaproteobacteria bacterium]|nr:polysaccharide deacetylase family protein [Alphaproteobacteria bacterium]
MNTEPWPADRPLAVSLNVMLEGWTDDSAPGIGPMGNPLRAGVLDLQARSWAEYGPKTGSWHLLEQFAAMEARAVWYVSGLLAERYSELIRAIVDAGHVVAAHGWAQNVLPCYQSAEAEKLDIDRCRNTLAATAGSSPQGWLSPRCTPSQRTTELLARAGFAWHADTFDSDVPYAVSTPTGPIVAMPFTMEVNDMPLYVRYGSEPQAFSRVLDRIVAHWPEIGGHRGCLDITVHAHVFGRPYGLIELREAVDMVRRCSWAWLTDHERLAALYAGAGTAAG